MIKICLYCGDEFEAWRKDNVYCSRKCIKKDYYHKNKGFDVKNTLLTCQNKNCSKTFYARRKRTEKYCSRLCGMAGCYQSNPQRYVKSSKKWREANPEKYRENSRKSSKKWRLANPEKYKEKTKRQYKKHAEKKRAYSRMYYRKNLEKCLENNKKSYQKNREKRIENSVKYIQKRLKTDLEFRKKHFSTHKLKNELAKKGVLFNLWESQNGRCNICKCELTLKNKNLDHIYPKSLGGKLEEGNIQWLCRSCNYKKGNRVYFVIDYKSHAFSKHFLDSNKI